MNANVGSTDKAIRIVVGLALLSLLFLLDGNARWWGLLGVPLLITGISGICPGYLALHFSTCKTSPRQQ